MGIRNFFQPDLLLERVTDLTPQLAAELGVRGLLIDIDCTLMPHGQWEVPADVRAWLGRLADKGLALHLVTNARRRRSEHIARSLALPCIHRAAKPLPWKTRRALDALGLPPDQVAIVGDQIFADVLVGKLVGLKTVLVRPCPGRQALSTLVKRPAEWLLLRWFGDRLKTATASDLSETCQSQKTSACTAGRTAHQPVPESDPPSQGPSKLH